MPEPDLRDFLQFFRELPADDWPKIWPYLGNDTKSIDSIIGVLQRDPNAEPRICEAIYRAYRVNIMTAQQRMEAILKRSADAAVESARSAREANEIAIKAQDEARAAERSAWWSNVIAAGSLIVAVVSLIWGFFPKDD